MDQNAYFSLLTQQFLFWDTTSAIESAIGQTNVKAEGCNSFTDYKNKDPSYLPMKCDHCYK